MATSKNINWKVESITLDRNNPYQHPFISAELSTSVLPKTWSPNELAMDLQDHLNKKATPEIKNVIFNPPATIVLWSDNTKTVVKCQDGDKYDPEKGLAMAIVKKMYGNTGKYCEIFKKWVPEVESEYLNIMLNLKFDGVSFAKAMDDVKKAAERSTMSFKEAANRLYGAPKKVDRETGWISVRDRMPTESGDYLVCDAFTGSVYVYEFGNDCRQDAAYWRAYITHWMPCPAAPTKKGE